MIIRTTTNRVCLPIASLLLLVLVSTRAEAKGLLMLDVPTQYVEFAYSLINNDTRTTHRLTPSYGLSVPFALLDPSFLVGSFGGSINYTLNESNGTSSDQSSSSSQLGYQYNVGGIFLKSTAHPLSFYAFSTENTVQQDFAPNTTVTYSSYGFNGVIKNKYLPLSYTYHHDDSKTDNEGSTTETVTDGATITLSHRVGSLMTTGLNGSYQQTENNSSILTANSTTNQATLNLINTLELSNFARQLGTLTSNLYIQSVSGTFPIDTRMLTENYDSSLGRALHLGASYTIGSTSSTFQTHQIRAGQLYVEHRLFDSLRTRLSGSFNDTSDNTGGSDSVTTGTAQVTYTKKLPLDAVLQLEASEGILERDSRLNSSLQVQLNELISVDSISKLYPLQNPRVTQVIEVRDRSLTRLFVTPNDYGTLVIGQTTYITINPTGAIHTGDVLSVTYEYQSDPTIKYTTNIMSATASYTLFNGRYLFLTQYGESSSTSIDGRPGSFVPPDSSFFRSTARANLENLIMGVEYRTNEDFSNKRDTFEDFAYYYKMFEQNNLGLQMSHSYNVYSSTGANGIGTSGDITENTLTIGTNWSRPLFLTGQMLLATNYQRVWGTLPSRDYLSARINYDLPLGKFKLHLDARTLVLMTDSAKTTTNNYVNISIRRYF